MRRLLVGLLALALAAGAAWVVLNREHERVRRDRAQARLLMFDARAVTGLELRIPGERWRFERGDDGWRVTRPVSDLASEDGIYDLLGLTQRVTVTETIEQPEALASYGLDPPFLTIEVLGPQVPALHIGTVTPLNDGVFARVEGRPGVLVIDRFEADAFRQPPQAFRERRLTGLLLSEVVAVDVRRGSKRLRLEREGDSWWLSEPVRVPASEPAVDRLLAALDETPVMGFRDEGTASDPQFGLSAADTWIVTLHTADRSQEVRIGSEAAEGARYALREDRSAILAVPVERLDVLTVDETVFASESLTSYNRYRVVRFDYRAGDGALSAARNEAGEWTASDGHVLDPGAVYGLLVRVLEAPVEGFDPPPAVEAAEPRATLEIAMEDGATDRITFWPDGRATVASLPHLRFRVSAAPPTITDRLKSPAGP